MRIFATCIVKNESDIIRQSLTAAASWCDILYVHDLGSADGTWEIVLEVASRLKQVVPYRQEERLFHDGIREETFNCYLSLAQEGDWWCPLDADEIYIDNPRTFLEAVPFGYGVVWSSCFEFMFTNKDLECYRKNPSLYVNRVPAENRLRYYANTWSESRFYRYQERQSWQSRPTPAGLAHPVRIRYKHYQYRSPEQIQKRLDTRRPALEAGVHFRHERREHWADYSQRAAELLAQRYDGPQTWEERIVDSEMLHYDLGDGNYISDDAALPPITDR